MNGFPRETRNEVRNFARFRLSWKAPLTRPSATLSPSEGEREGVRGRFMESPLSFFACIGTHEPPLTRPSATLSPSDGEREGVRGRFMERRAAGRFKRCASKFPCLKARNLL